MKLRYFIDDKTKKKVYTMKEKVDDILTKDAHYKFIRIRDAPLKNINGI